MYLLCTWHKQQAYSSALGMAENNRRVDSLLQNDISGLMQLPSMQLNVLFLQQSYKLAFIIWLILLMREYGHLPKIKQIEYIKVKISS